MADSNTLIKTLLGELKQDVSHYQQMANQLKEQHNLLVNRDNQALTPHNAAMEQLMATLNQHAANRQTILNQLGTTADNQGMQTLLAKLPQPIQDQAKQWWQQVYQLTLTCQELNNTNGRLLAQQKQLIDRLLKPEQQFCYAPAQP
ncbi:hypothetical protein A3K86_09690 [Photobacterium jeanii]|uniref:Flagellar protein FlgN n=1 Tax=Photobacterium jeanii TaxID=858640 RepID=A0A178KHD2_9GAMM|nr:flagellar protein FlgN [Photobacterium jeanii]OAN16708.1 hypothetical protein A3K86_09690 [Photobacterium jeanii]PST87437.1 flagellar protein FlgN [Photobacterium jeanii]